MSKTKLSFSLILAILLVGILSTAAFAKSLYSSKAYQIGSTITAYFKGLSTDPANSTYTLKLVTGGSAVASQDVSVDSSLNGSYAFPLAQSDLNGTTFTVQLYLNGTLVETTNSVTTMNANNGPVLSLTNPKTDADGNAISVDKNGSGLVNDNHTGLDQPRKNRQNPKQQIHGFYQNNTNSCASCHQAHTGNDSRTTRENSLLFKDGVYSTCSACHDGTTGAYNAFSPVSEGKINTMSGTFNVQTAGHNGSLHEADGSLKVAAAPGGNSDKTSKEYGQNFDCASCHAAHGSGGGQGTNSEENNLNIDPLGWGGVTYTPLKAGQKLSGDATVTSAQKDALNGKLFKSIGIYTRDTIPTGYDVTGQDTTKGSTPYILAVFTATSTDASNFFYQRAGVTEGTKVIQTYRWSGDTKKYIPDYSLWLQELGYPFKANTKLMNKDGKDITRANDLTVVWRDGFAFGSGVGNIYTADVSVGIDVETPNLEDPATLFDDTDPNYVLDSGVEMSKFCASCHVDYLSTTRTDNTGIYTQAHRHATGIDETTCIRCHFAHGSEAQIMKDANDNTYYDLITPATQTNATDGRTGVGLTADQALNYLLDPNPSSALKRFTGMSVCYACHGKGEQFLGNPNTNQPDQVTGQYLMNGNPADVGETGEFLGDGRTSLAPGSAGSSAPIPAP